jgi:hypothetical protein
VDRRMAVSEYIFTPSYICLFSWRCLVCFFKRHRWRRFDEGLLRYWACARCECMVPRRSRFRVEG